MTTIVIDTKRLGRVLFQARNEHWSGRIPKQVPPSLSLAIDSIRHEIPNFWEKDPQELERFLHANPGVRKTFEETEDDHLAFAIRLARM